MELIYAGFGTQGVIERGGCQLHYWLRESSRPNAPVVMFIHGAGVDHRMWASQIDAFADEYRVLTFDVRGHGRSSPGGAFIFDALVEDAFALAETFKNGKIAVIGLSMGGNIAQEMVFRRPSGIGAVICVDCTCNTLVPFFDRLLLPFYRSIFRPLMAFYPRETLIRHIGAFSSSTSDGRRYVSAAAAQLSKTQLTDVMTVLLEALHHEPGYRTAVPQLLCCGERDRLGNIRKVMPLWRRRDLDTELAVIPSASHCSNIDNPAAFNRITLDWLAQHFV